MGFEAVLTAETNGITAAYSDAGGGEPLLLVNGGAGETCEYQRFLPYIAHGIRTIAYDQRGFGGTVGGDEPYTLKTLADDAVALLDALGVARAHVLGFSYGGMLALQMGLQHPDRIQSLIVGTAPYTHADMVSNFDGTPPQDYARRLVEMCLTPKGLLNPELVAELSLTDRAHARRRDTVAGARRIAAPAGFDMTGRGKDISAPTLLLYGGDDPMSPPRFGQRLNEEIPNSRLIVFEGARHSFFREFSAEVGQRVSDWILGHPLEAGSHPRA
jgi:3-oxoadipate enol-lactonase